MLLGSSMIVISGTGGFGLTGYEMLPSVFPCSLSSSRLFLGDSWPTLHFGSKLTIGLPGRSLTAVGVGNLGLLSLFLILVAALMSSPRISSARVLGLSLCSGSFSCTGVCGSARAVV